jgi:hypothetical protein
VGAVVGIARRNASVGGLGREGFCDFEAWEWLRRRRAVSSATLTLAVELGAIGNRGGPNIIRDSLWLRKSYADQILADSLGESPQTMLKHGVIYAPRTCLIYSQ